MTHYAGEYGIYKFILFSPEMDDNGDGRIDQEEFVSACLTRRKASTSLTLKIVGIFVADGETDKTIK